MIYVKHQFKVKWKKNIVNYGIQQNVLCVYVAFEGLTLSGVLKLVLRVLQMKNNCQLNCYYAT